MKSNNDKQHNNYSKAVSILHNPITAWVILAISLCLTFVAWRISSDFSQQLAKDRFEFRVQEIVHAIRERMNVYEQALRGGVALFNTNGEVSRVQWKDYITSINIDKNWPGIQGMGYAIPISPAQKEQHIASIRAEGFSAYTIKPEGVRNSYSSIIYLEPFDWRNQRAFGFDMWSNDMRREAMMRARDTGEPSTSGIITLVQETKENIQKGFLTYLPVYRKNSPIGTVEERRAAFKGWVYSPFRAGNLMQDILGTADIDYDFEIYDGYILSEEGLLFDSDTVIHTKSKYHHPALSKKINLEIQGRSWLVYVHTNKLPTALKEAISPKVIAIGGVIIDLMLFYVIFAIYNLQKRAQKIATKMSATIAEERQLLRDIIDNLPINVYLKDKSSKKILANRAEYEYMGGKSEEEVIGKNDYDVYLDNAADASREEDLQVLSGKMIVNKETINYRKDGVIRHFLVSKYPLLNHQQEIHGVLGISIDITEQKEAENTLLRTQELLQRTSQVAKVGGWAIDYVANAIHWSDVTKQIYGVSDDFVANFENTLGFYKNDYYRNKITAAFTKAVDTGEGWNEELEIITQEGHDKWVRVIGQAKIEDGQCIRIYGVIQDIHERKMASLALAKVKMRLELATKEAGIGIWEYNLSQNTITWDDQMYYLYGRKKENFSNVYEAWQNSLHPDDQERLDREIAMAIAGEKDFNTEFRVLWPDGNIRNIRAIAVVQKNNEGVPIYMIGTNWDITKEKELQQTLIDARKYAEEANKSKSEFLANMSHEIRTPLNSIIGFSDLLVKTPLDETQQLYMNSVNQSGIALLDLINDILDFSKIEAGKLELAIEKTDLREMIGQVVEIVQYKVQEKKLQLIQYVAPNVPHFAWIDSIRVKQILINLLGNAVKFTEKGKIILAVSLGGGLIEGKEQHIVFSVKDTGIGIPTHQQQHIFKAFTQADYSTTRKYGGTGLGLSISNQLLSLMGSHMQLSSEQGKGSRFFFSLFTKTSGAEASPYATNTSQEAAKITTSLSNIKVLVVDDNPINLLLAKSIITHLIPHVTIIEANDGEQGIELFFQHLPMIVFMDIQMPRMSGYEAVQAIRNLETDTSIPIIALTAGTVKGEKERCLAAGMNDYLSKPIVADRVLTMLNKWLPNEPSQEPGKVVLAEMPHTPQHFNKTKLLDHLKGDNQTLKEMLDLVRNGIFEQLVKDIDQAIVDQDERSFKMATHTIKGVASSLYFEILTEQVSVLETLPIHTPQALSPFLDQIKEELSILQKTLLKEGRA